MHTNENLFIGIICWGLLSYIRNISFLDLFYETKSKCSRMNPSVYFHLFTTVHCIHRTFGKEGDWYAGREDGALGRVHQRVDCLT